MHDYWAEGYAPGTCFLRKECGRLSQWGGGGAGALFLEHDVDVIPV